MTFVTKGSELFWLLRIAIQNGHLALPEDPKLHSQLTQIEYVVESDRAIRVYKQGLKDRFPSPDLADALALALEAHTRGALTVNETAQVFF